MRFYLVTVGEDRPDFFSSKIQDVLSEKYNIKCEVSHALILVEDAGKWSGIWESIESGFFGPKDPKKEWKGCHVGDKILLNVQDELGAIRWLRDFVGTPYPTMQFFLYLPRWIKRVARKLTPKWILKKIFNGKSASWCSESCGHFMRNFCVGAFEDPKLSIPACDHLDPVNLVPLAKKYSKIQLSDLENSKNPHPWQIL